MSTEFLDFAAFDIGLDGASLINASAGTGKTYAITSLVVRLVVEKQLPIDKILVVTFTEAATAELRTRIRERIRTALDAFRFSWQRQAERTGDAELDNYAERRRKQGGAQGMRVDTQHLEQALKNLDQAAISTIHGFCLRVLQNAAFESGVPFQAEISTDLSTTVDQILDDFWTNSLHDASPTVLSLLLAKLRRQSLRGVLGTALRSPDLKLVPERWPSPLEPPDAQLLDKFFAAGAAFEPSEVLHLLATARDIKRPRADSRSRSCENLVAFFTRLPSSIPHDTAEREALTATLIRAWPRTARNLTKPKLQLPGQASAQSTALAYPFWELCESVCDAVDQAKALDAGRVAGFKCALLSYARDEFSKRKAAMGQISFDDMLLILRDRLRGPRAQHLISAVQSNFQAALIDEFQDTDPVQFAIFHSVFGDGQRPLFMIGDPKQAIYAFRGADVFAFLKALSTTDDGSSKYGMRVNWRSDPGLLDAVNALFAPQPSLPNPFLIDGIAYSPVNARPGARNEFDSASGSAPLDVLFAPRERVEHEHLPQAADEPVRPTRTAAPQKGTLTQRVPVWIARDISRLLRSATIGARRVTPSDVAVLCRTNRQCFEVQDELRRLQIPAVVLGDETVFRSREAEELTRVLAAVLEPNSATQIRRALTTDLLGISANQLQQLELQNEEWDRWAMRFRRWNRLWKERGFVQMFRALLAESESPERILILQDGERRMTNLLHLLELLHVRSRESHLGPAGLLHWLVQERQNAEARKALTAEQAEIRLESDAAAVKLTTIHKSKGLEFPIVYCPYLWDGKLLFDNTHVTFHPPPTHDLTLDVDAWARPEHRHQAEAEALAENLRLLYVALTRAKHRCTVLWVGAKGVAQSALGTLLHPPDLLTGLDMSAFKKRLQDITDEELLAALGDAERRSNRAIQTRLLDPNEAGVPLPLDAPEGTEVRVRSIERSIPSDWRTASFSSLARHATAAPPLASAHADLVERDHDEWSALAFGTAGPASALAPPLPEPPAPSPDAPSRPVTLLDFPRGARAGTCFHEILEHHDFTDDAGLAAAVERGLVAHGFDVETHHPAVTLALREALSTPLGGHCGALTLNRITQRQRRNEMEFSLPVTSLEGAGSSITTSDLCSVFRDHPSAAVPQPYHEVLRQLTFPRLRGFLKGYIDLVFEHQGRYYVVDYKTNHLGDDTADYGLGAMQQEMVRSHYFLQYHLYAIAVHRLLARRISGYNYATHFGGVYYLFLKGMNPASGRETGVFFEHPPEARLLALDALFSPGQEGRAA